MRRFLILLIYFIVLSSLTSSMASPWSNDLRKLYVSGNAVIYGINIRTFSAVDKDGDGIINIEAGEKRGNFLSAIRKLDELAALNINTINILPVLPVGKSKAIGTAGSLYAPCAFDRINPQLKAPISDLTVEEEMEAFVAACHKRGLRVIVDLPCCAAYDLFLTKPSLFLKDASNNPVMLSDWTDVRVLNAGTDNNLNQDVYNLYLNFFKIMIGMGVDGVKVNSPETKPYSFWKNQIDQVRKIEPQFLFLAETSNIDRFKNDKINLLSVEQLLEAGFDGYYGKYDSFADIAENSQLYNLITKDIEFAKKYNDKKVLMNFVTHDQMSPIIKNGEKLSSMIMWLQATLPFNAYYIDGFSTGDNYNYAKANRKADVSFTDDEYYFVHRGKLDIFNFSRALDGQHKNLINDFANANKVKSIIKTFNAEGTLKVLKTDNKSVFAYQNILKKTTVIVIGNLNFNATSKAVIKVPGISSVISMVPVKFESAPKISKNKIEMELAPGEVFVAILMEPQVQ